MPDADVAAGQYDSYLVSHPQAAKAFGHPLFLLFDEEMNGTWYSHSPGRNGNTAAGFVAMWRHVHDVFEAVGATNVTWVWCPNVDPGRIFTPFSQVYPGDAYVDWTGLNGYNWGGSEWTSFSSVFAASYASLVQVPPSKPIMIGEVASGESGGSKAPGSPTRSRRSCRRTSRRSRPCSGSTGGSTRRARGGTGRSNPPPRPSRRSRPLSTRATMRAAAPSAIPLLTRGQPLP